MLQFVPSSKQHVYIFLQVTSVIVKKQTMSHMEKDMNRWLKVKICTNFIQTSNLS